MIGQDAYHQELLNLLQEDYNLENPSFVFFDSEQSITEAMYIYGDASLQSSTITDNTFSILQAYTVHAAGNNAWDSGAGMRNINPVNKDDVIVVTFWARRVSDASELTFFAEDGVTFDKEIDFKMAFTPDWARYFGAFKAKKDYAVDGLVTGFHLATTAQSFELGGFTALNFGDVDLSLAPSTFSPARYGGYELDAAWRSAADQRIIDLRTKELTVLVTDATGKPLPNVEIKVEMLSHAFGFGSAMVGCRFPNNRCPDERYLDKIINLDGEGHGFNVAVLENALKWDGWEEEWIGTPEETVAAVEWLIERDIKVRGHTLIWPGWNHLPNDMQANQNDLSYLRTRIENRLLEMLEHPKLGVLINEWDALNEITQVRDLEKAFTLDPNFSTGREIYQDILKQTKSLNPNLASYINDYVVLSGGGAGTSVVNRYRTYLDEILASGADFDGIGFQCHIGSQPTSILKIKEVLDTFSNAYGKRIKITEFDINPSVDEETQGKYLTDFLTMVFSHPAVDAFLMWGFWDGNHWKGNAPLFNLDWTLKPSGQAFIQKVFKDWWTNESGLTTADGSYVLRPFKGQFKISATMNGTTLEQMVSTSALDTIKFNFESTSVTDGALGSIYQVFPNPATSYFQIERLNGHSSVNVEVSSIDGRTLYHWEDIYTNNRLAINLTKGLYLVKIEDQDHSQVTRLIIQSD